MSILFASIPFLRKKQCSMPGPSYTRLLQIEAESGLDFITSLKDFTLQPGTRDERSSTRNHPHLHSHPNPHQNPHFRQQQQRPYWATSAATHVERSRLGAEESTRTGVSLGLEGIDPILEHHGLLFPGDMMDIYGSSCSGKTLVLYAVIISTILPFSWDYSPSTSAPSSTLSREPLVLKGKAKSVLFIDTDQGFSVERLADLLRLRIRNTMLQNVMTREHRATGSTKASEGLLMETEEISLAEGGKSATATSPKKGPVLDVDSIEISQKVEGLVEACLQNVHVFRPPDAISTIVQLRTMDQYLQHHQREHSQKNPPVPRRQEQQQQQHQDTPIPIPTASIPGAPFSLLMIDSISSFYWQERTQSTTHHNRVLSSTVDAFHRLSQHWDLVLISTSWSLPSTTSFAPSNGPSRSNADKTLTDGYRKRLKYRFLMQSRNLERFTSENELLEAWQTREDSVRNQEQQQQQQQQHQQQQSDKPPDQERQHEHGQEMENQHPHQPLEPWEQDTGLNDRMHVIERSGSVFQAQMILPSVSQSEIFRISVSDREGVHVFEAPPAPQ